MKVDVRIQDVSAGQERGRCGRCGSQQEVLHFLLLATLPLGTTELPVQSDRAYSACWGCFRRMVRSLKALDDRSSSPGPDGKE